MDEGFIFVSFFSYWDVDENEKVKINFGTYRDQLVVIIYGSCGVENCIVVLIEAMNEDCE
jgi:hypothetical protein